MVSINTIRPGLLSLAVDHRNTHVVVYSHNVRNVIEDVDKDLLNYASHGPAADPM